MATQLLRDREVRLNVKCELDRPCPGRIKVLYVISSLNRGGAEKQLFLLLSGLDRNIYQPSLVTLSDGEWSEALKKLNIPVTVIGLQSRIRQIVRLFQIYRTEKPVILHCIGTSAGLRGRIAEFFYRIPVTIMSERSSPERLALVSRLAEWFLNLFTDRVITNSSHALRYFEKHPLLKSCQITVIHNGIEDTPLPTLQASKRPLDQSSKINIGYLANMIALKNHELVIRAAEILKNEIPGLHFYFAGDGPRLQELKSLCRAIGLEDRFVFLGQISSSQDFLATLDFYVHASKIEGAPNAIMEAMVSGIPVVAAPSEGAIEVLEQGKLGTLLKDFEPSSLAQSIREVVHNKVDYRGMAATASELTRTKYSVARMVEATERIYQEEICRIAWQTPVAQVTADNS